MPGLDRYGFLSPRIARVRRDVRREFQLFLAFSRKLNCLAHDLMFEISFDRDDPQQLLLVCLYQRALTTYQAVIVLSESGLQSEAKVEVRTLLDAMFRLVAIAKDSQIGLLYIQQDDQSRRRLVRKFQSLSEATKYNLDTTAITRIAEEVDRALALRAPPEGSTEWFANKADLRDFYLSVYAVLSGAVHVSVRDLEDEFEVNEQGDVLGFNYKPRTDKLQSTLAVAFEALIFCMRGTFTVLPTNRSSEIDEIHNQFRELHVATFERPNA